MSDSLKTGSSLLDKALGDGIPFGVMVNLVGDTTTGKSLLAASICRDACKNKLGVVYFDLERTMDKEFFDLIFYNVGGATLEIDKKTPPTVRDIYKSIKQLLESDKPPGLIVIDTVDALVSLSDMNKNVDERGYNMGKTIQLGTMLREFNALFDNVRCVLLLVSQVRVNISGFGEKYVRSGGKSLDFWTSKIIWLKQISKLIDTKTKNVYGFGIEAKIKKNKKAPLERIVKFPILFGFGIDDVRSLLDFYFDALSDLSKQEKEKFESLDLIKAGGGRYTFGGFKGYLPELVNLFWSDEKVYKQLKICCEQLWDLRELGIKNRYLPKRSTF